MNNSKLVLRSLNLPQDLDEVLRVIAFHERTTKTEVIRRMLEVGVESYQDKLATWAPHLLPPIVEAAKKRASSGRAARSDVSGPAD